ncbi:MAG: 2-C-methyl-D-erythritol 2,4-cyclodiphosphate synthase [Sphaerochaetaceae bacterium]
MIRIGSGWDIHPMIENRRLLLGGVEIPHHLGEAGHSDADVLLHALIDALLGSLALGDIGTYFPSEDDKWLDISSKYLLKETLKLIAGYKIGNIDCTVILQEPKLKAHISKIRASIASLCNISVEKVSVKAKTADNLLGQVGEGRAVIAQASVLLFAD